MADCKLTIEVAERDHARTFAGALSDLIDPPPAALTLFEQGDVWRIEAYFDEPPEPMDMAARLAALTGLAAPDVVLEDVPDLNWVAISQAALPPVTAGRFTIHGRHDRYRVARGPNAIEIEAGEAFGTAHHATTSGCLEAIDRLTRRIDFRDVLDLGCGTGVLALAAARALPLARIEACDVDPTSVEVANANIRLNGAAGRIRARTANGVARGERYDLVIANILAGPLIILAPHLAKATMQGGYVILSGILVPQAAKVIAAYRAAGYRVVDHRRSTGWSTLTFIRR